MIGRRVLALMAQTPAEAIAEVQTALDNPLVTSVIITKVTLNGTNKTVFMIEGEGA